MLERCCLSTYVKPHMLEGCKHKIELSLYWAGVLVCNISWFSMSPLPRLHHHAIMTIVGLPPMEPFLRDYSIAMCALAAMINS